jgi:hypothetical protein
MAAPYDLLIDQGSDFKKIMTWKVNNLPVDLTGCSAKLQIRAAQDHGSELRATYSSPAAGIVLGGVLGTITITIPHADTILWAWKVGYWDIEITFIDLTVRRLLQGKVFNDYEVTG